MHIEIISHTTDIQIYCQIYSKAGHKWDEQNILIHTTCKKKNLSGNISHTCPLLFIMFDSHWKTFKPNNGPNLAGDFHNFN